MVGIIRLGWVHSDVSRACSGLFGLIARPGVRQVYLGSLGSALGVVGLIRERPDGCPVHSCSLGSFSRVLEVVGFLRLRSVFRPRPGGRRANSFFGVHFRALGVLRFIRACSGGRWVHLCTHKESLGSRFGGYRFNSYAPCGSSSFRPALEVHGFGAG